MQKKVIVASSGGPDSMALLDQLYKKGYSIVAAHVNYKKRKTADRDEQYLKSYCEQRNILVRVLYPKQDVLANFQSWAREVRYQFFFDLAKEYHTDEIYVAHHLDDHIETYLFQKKRKMLCDTFGLSSCVCMQGFKILRPELDKTKKELEMYCIENHISYGIDESNLSNDYTRNQIRHSILDTMTLAEKKEMAIQIEKENEALAIQRNRAYMFLETWKHDVKTLKEQEEAWFILDCWFYQMMHVHLSKKHIFSLLSQIESDCFIDLKEYEFESYKGILYLKKKRKPISISLKDFEYKDFPAFSLKPMGETIESFHLQASDFPICIRTVKEGDSIHLRFGNKKVSRFFIDRKIPRIYRKDWLVVENTDGKVVFVPGIGCDVEHFCIKANMFMIQYLT